jgi:hypothetical protein
VKPLRSQEAQQQIPLDRLADWLKDWFKQAGPGMAGSC